jgi:cathepsin F
VPDVDVNQNDDKINLMIENVPDVNVTQNDDKINFISSNKNETNITTPTKVVNKTTTAANLKEVKPVPVETIPKNFDWRTKGAVGVVKNQGSCGACWAFTAVANIEGLYFLKYGVMKNFAEQHLVDCSTANYGCNGGFMEKAYSYIKSAGGLQLTSDYGSYKQIKKTCTYNKSKAVAKVKSWYFPGKNETVIRDYLYKTGPISAALDASLLQNYRSGIYNPKNCSTKVNHGVTLVGYGTANGVDYWIVKNSWGPNWGEKGYFRIKRGTGACGINTYIVSAILA